jgi:hypothetical protein
LAVTPIPQDPIDAPNWDVLHRFGTVTTTGTPKAFADAEILHGPMLADAARSVTMPVCGAVEHSEFDKVTITGTPRAFAVADTPHGPTPAPADMIV